MSRYLMSLALTITLLLSPFISFAGDTVNNGGVLVVCDQPKSTSLEVQPPAGVYAIDYLQMRGSVDFVYPNSLKESFDRIERLLSELPALQASFKNYRKLIRNGSLSTGNRIWHLSDVGLVRLNDEQALRKLPGNCQSNEGAYGAFQVIIRRVEGKFTFYEAYRPLLDKIEANALQASLLHVHEWLWDYAVNAYQSRQVNVLLHSKEVPVGKLGTIFSNLGMLNKPAASSSRANQDSSRGRETSEKHDPNLSYRFRCEPVNSSYISLDQKLMLIVNKGHDTKVKVAASTKYASNCRAIVNYLHKNCVDNLNVCRIRYCEPVDSSYEILDSNLHELIIYQDAQTEVKTIDRFSLQSDCKPYTSFAKPKPNQASTKQDIDHSNEPKQDTNQLGMRFAQISAGTFMMGSPSTEEGRYKGEGPQHKVTISNAFEMQVTEVTRGQWLAVMGSYPDNNPSVWKDGICHPTVKEDHHPVTCVSWNDAQDFIAKLNEQDLSYHYRLPTEAEWEYAARAGTTTPYSVDGPLESFAWYRENSGGQTHPVARLKANGFGLYDVYGNVWEMTADWYGAYSSSHVTDPTGPSHSSGGSYHVFRGGCWYDYAWSVRSAFRSGFGPGGRDYAIGLRLLRTPK